ncbi:MAG TPA: oligosaccharide flippase family protein [Polyangiaceae bacterium]|nr:oligosaccharide flippase family protein [Polyangiaceae bacterium]
MSSSLQPTPESPAPVVEPPASPEIGSKGLDRATLNRRAKWGVLILGGRTAVQQLIVLAGQVYLARVLGPADFGVFWIVQFALSFFALFGDAGFGAALIQKRDTATQSELSSVFWSQLLLVSLVTSVIFASAPWVVKFWPDLPANAAWLLRALSLSLLLTSLRVVPAILMERELLFGRLSVIDLLLSMSFYCTAVVLAHLGYGTTALVIGVLVQGVVGLITAFSLRPWLPGLHFDTRVLRPILNFGVVLQAKNIIGFVNAAIMPLYAGRALGRYPLGIVTWSRNTSIFSVAIVDILSRVNFPLLSRLQHDRGAFARALERTIQISAIVTFLFVALLLGLAPSVVRVIYGEKWLPALPTLYVFTCTASISFLIPIINGALDALGKPRIMMLLGLAWTILNWSAVTLVMQIRHDAFWFAIGFCVHVVLGSWAVWLVVKHFIPEAKLWSRIRGGLAAGVVTTIAAHTLLLPWANGAFSLAAAALLAIAVFVGCCAVFDRSALLELLSMLRKRQAPSSA